ncbi:hypothetical protein [Rosistilla oblonga]|uniref:hypothetical protein n=1 Tax=Rosistilla oblonga TaxID=2527990 RepID=UPI003A9744FD
MNTELKVAVTVAEMARMAGLSRARMYQLMGKAFPMPSRDEAGRPYFDEEQQRTILEVRRRNCGVDGKPILFYAPRNSVAPSRTMKRRAKPKAIIKAQHTEIADGIRSLGLVVTDAHVASAIQESFPDGIESVESGDVVRTVFLSIQRKN